MSSGAGRTTGGNMGNAGNTSAMMAGLTPAERRTYQNMSQAEKRLVMRLLSRNGEAGMAVWVAEAAV
jgi:hypothetical protein